MGAGLARFYGNVKVIDWRSMAVAGPTSATRGKITVTIDSVEISSCFDSGRCILYF